MLRCLPGLLRTTQSGPLVAGRHTETLYPADKRRWMPRHWWRPRSLFSWFSSCRGAEGGPGALARGLCLLIPHIVPLTHARSTCVPTAEELKAGQEHWREATVPHTPEEAAKAAGESDGGNQLVSTFLCC